MRNYFLLRLILSLVFINSVSSVNAAETYPKALSANDARQYFAQYSKIQVRHQSDTIEIRIKGYDIERDCDMCRVITGYGTINYKGEKVCFDWDVRTPDSGCYHFVQVNQGGFELQNNSGDMVYAWGNKNQKVVIKSGPAYQEKFERAILIDLGDIKPTKKKMHSALVQAIKNKGWRIEKDENNTIVARIKRQDIVYRIMARTNDYWVGVGFVSGFAPSGDGWLYNVKKQLLVLLEN